MANQSTFDQYPDWVDAKRKEAHKAIFAQLRDYDKNYSSQLSSAALAGVRQYLNRGVMSLSANGYMNELDGNNQLNLSPSTSKVNFNLTAAAIDTLTSKLASIPTVPQSVTDKGNVKGRKLAEDINYILKGVFHKYNLSGLINQAYRGAMISRAEYIKVNVVDGELSYDRVYMDEIVVDPADGYYNNPFKMIQRKYVPLHVAIKKFPKYEQQLRDSQIQEVRQYNTQTYTPCVVIAEAWCKNTYKEGGRHVICIENTDILDEEWDKNYFPVVKCDYNKPVIGYIGQSVVDELAPLQREIDRILVTMQAIMKLVSVPRIFIDTNSMVNDAHITNKIGMILKYDGKQGVAPTIHNGAAMAPELPAQLEFLIQQGFIRVGLSPSDVQGQAQTNLESGEAIKKVQEVKSERWRLLQQMFEDTHVELANVTLWELQGTNIKIKALDKHIGLKEINTKRIPKTQDSYVLKIFPVSSLPEGIGDRIDTVERMVNMGIIPVSMVPELFDMPDLGTVVAMQSAPKKLVDKNLEEMEDSLKYKAPEPYHDLEYAMTAAIQKYSWAQLNNESEKFQSLLRHYMNDVKILLAQKAPVTQQPPQPIPQGQLPQ